MGTTKTLNCTLIEKIQSLVLESTVPTTFWFYAELKANFLYNRSSHLYFDNYIPFLAQYIIYETFKRLVPYKCKADLDVQLEIHGKLYSTSSIYIMFRYSEISTELCVLDFVLAETFMAP